MNYSGAEIIVEFLRVNGYKHVFGIPGRRILSFFDAVNRSNGGIKMITTRHEQGAAFMAEVYSRINGKGCCVGISAPGAVNLLAGAASAYMDSIPLLIFAGQAQVPDMGKYPVQEATGIGRTPNQLQIYKSTTKYAVSVEKIEDLLFELEKAYTIMQEGRKGPVYIELPTNILEERIDCDIKKVELKTSVYEEGNVTQEMLKKVTDILLNSKKPLMLLGNGVQNSGAVEEYRQFFEKNDVPYGTTLLAKGILDEKNKLSLGTIGIFGQKAANKYLLDESDAVIAIGTTFQELSSMVWRTEIANKLKVRIDIDIEEINRNYLAENVYLLDAKKFIVELDKYLMLNNIVIKKADALEEVARLKEQYGYFKVSEDSEEGLHPGKVVEKINLLLKENDILLSDIGENGYWSSLLIQRKNIGTYILNGGYGSMGHAVAGSVGAAMTNPKGNVVTICGDGGFLMNGNEVATAKYYKSKVIWCVLDNGILGTQKHFQEREYGGRIQGSIVPSVDIYKYAESMGVKSFCVRTLSEFENAYQQALEEEDSVVIDIKVLENIAPEPQCKF